MLLITIHSRFFSFFFFARQALFPNSFLHEEAMLCHMFNLKQSKMEKT